MESFVVRYRNILVLLAILVAQIVGLAVQVRRTDTGRSTLDPRDGPGVHLIRFWAVSIVSPPERLIHSSKLGMDDLWLNYIDLRGVRQQNKDLQQTIDRLRLEQAALLEDARQGQRLQQLLGFQEKYIYKTVAAQVIGSSGSQQSQVFYIDKGSDDGLARDMAVITPDGIVGKVRDAFPHTAQVLAVNDQSSGAGVILETTRIRGILRGNAAGQLMVVGILADERIQTGEKVLTAGGDLIFPRGLPVGTVEKIVRDPERDSFIDVIIKPAAHLDRLDEVLVITSLEPRFSGQELQDMATSEVIKGAEAQAIKDQAAKDQAIKDQLKASQIMAERLPGLTAPGAPGASGTTGASGAASGTTSGTTSSAGTTQAAPPAPKLLPTLHPDRLSPQDETPGVAAPDSSTTTGAKTAQKPAAPQGQKHPAPRRNP